MLQAISNNKIYLQSWREEKIVFCSMFKWNTVKLIQFDIWVLNHYLFAIQFFFAAFYHISYRKIKSVLSNAHYNSDVLTRAQYAIIVFAYSNVYVNFRLRFSFCRWCMTLFFIRLVSVYEIGLCMSCCNASTFTKSLKQLEFFFLFGLLKLALPLCCSIEMVMPK